MRPSREELFWRLRKLEDVSSWEKLARRLDIDNRRLTDWRKGKGLFYEETVALLDRAGYLNHGAAAPAEPDLLDRVAEAIEGAVAKLNDATKLLAEEAEQPPSEAAGH